MSLIVLRELDEVGRAADLEDGKEEVDKSKCAAETSVLPPRRSHRCDTEVKRVEVDLPISQPHSPFSNVIYIQHNTGSAVGLMICPAMQELPKVFPVEREVDVGREGRVWVYRFPDQYQELERKRYQSK